MAEVIFIQRNGQRRVCSFGPGETLMSVARRNAIGLEGACDGALACSTCHVIVDNAWYSRLPRPHVEENGMLDLAYGVTRNSRLGCQIVLTESLNGLTVAVV